MCFWSINSNELLFNYQPNETFTALDELFYARKPEVWLEETSVLSDFCHLLIKVQLKVN